MHKTRDAVQAPYEGLLASMPRTPAVRAYPHTLSRAASTTRPQPNAVMEPRITPQGDSVDLVVPFFLLLGILTIFIVVSSSLGLQDTPRDPSSFAQASTHHRKSTRLLQAKRLGNRARSRMSHPKLPIEVIEYIIDHLHDNNLALATCKLVHSTWLPRARMHLHRTIIFELGGPDPFKLRFFPQVAQHVRELIVSYQLLREVGASVLLELGMIESLQVIVDPGTNGGRLLSVTDFPRFSRLKELHVDTLGFTTHLAVLFSIAKVPSITSLTVDVSPPSHGWTGHDLRHAQIQDILNKCPSVRLASLNLRCRWMASNRLGALPQTLLELAGVSLKHVTFTGVRADNSPDIFFYSHKELSFSKNPSIETVTIAFTWQPALLYLGETRQRYHISLATTFLSSLRHTKLHSIYVQIYIDLDKETLLKQLRYLNLAWLNGFVAPMLDGIPNDLVREETRVLGERLKRVAFKLRFSCKFKPDEATAIRTHVYEKLASLTARGVLELDMVI